MQALDIQWDEGALALERVLHKKEQADCPVVHRFGPGIYIREVTIPAGALAIGHHQNFEHLNIVLAGRAKLLQADGSFEMVQAPAILVTQPGRKIAYVYETLVWQNVYATDETDVAKLEAHFLTKSPVERDKVLGLEQFERTVDREDFKALLAEFGLSAKFVRMTSESMHDRIDFPFGSYSVQVGPSSIEGKGLFATANFKNGAVIAPARIDGKRTIAGRYANHAKEPNACAVLYDSGDVAFMAIQDIKGNRGGSLGEEITVDYRQVLAINEVSQCQA